MTEAAPAPLAVPPRFDAVLLLPPAAERRVGGLTLLERAAFTLARAGAGRLLCLGSRPPARVRLPLIALTWAAAGDRAALAAWCAAAAPMVIAMRASGVIDRDTVVALATAPATGTLAVEAPPLLWRAEATAVPGLIATLLEHGETEVPGDHQRRPAGAIAWRPPAGALVARADDPPACAAAERALYARLGRPGDGWFTRLVDRRVSRALTRLMLPTGVTPNQVTLGSIAMGIAAGLLFATGDPRAETAAALLFLLSTIVDGCDGEIARLTFQESEFGARLDVIGDNVVHLCLFGGIACGLYRRAADPRVALLGGALVTGVVLAMAAVYFCFVRRAPTPAQRAFFEAFASREFTYLLVLLTLVGRLEWFLWAAALGTYVFVAGVLLLGRVRSA